jgi:tetratricopeptide (TPR) repeat protein
VRHESRRHAWARLLTSAAIVAAIAFWFFSLPPSQEQERSARPEAPADPSLRFLAAAERAVASYRIDQFDQALVEYGKALGYHEHDAHILSGIAHVHALWAEELRGQSKSKPALETQESDAHAQRAKHYAELALQGNPGNSEAQLALSDALRLTGDLPAARSALTGVPASAEMYRVSALLALREARDGDRHKATELAAQAVAADPTLLSARFLLARLLCMQGEPDTARAQVAAIAAAAPQHPELQRLESLLAIQAPNVVAEATAKPAANNSEADMLIERAHGMLEAGQLTAARRTFEHVLVLQPGSVAAHAGLGQAAIARGRHLQALDHLVAAALGGDSESLIALAETYRRLGRQREALTAYQSYLQQNPNGAQLELAKSQIERLGEQFASARKP